MRFILWHALHGLHRLSAALSLGVALTCAGCAPFYSWGYAPVIRPEATTAYIHAVMARESDDACMASAFYDEALSYTWSDPVRRERDEADRLCHAAP